jgi:ribosomal protein L40E
MNLPIPRLCVKCGAEIPQARLEAKPDATMCVKCATKNDKPYTATLAPDPDAPHPRGW